MPKLMTFPKVSMPTCEDCFRDCSRSVAAFIGLSVLTMKAALIHEEHSSFLGVGCLIPIEVGDCTVHNH